MTQTLEVLNFKTIHPTIENMICLKRLQLQQWFSHANSTTSKRMYKNSTTKCSEKVEKFHKEIESVKINCSRRPNVLIIRVPLNQVISVMDYVHPEQQCCDASIDRTCDLSEGEKHLQRGIIINIFFWKVNWQRLTGNVFIKITGSITTVHKPIKADIHQSTHHLNPIPFLPVTQF